ncbi:uncharacterized protein LOC130993019 [Salvia miltiorrhiza]|uniref:uncharacterized protein LOC130993019 n=1 Tax=Salvia miltiorrhiza TaxID=226208 RepID=UPI0025ABB6F0|nr:uncharacterized protein LOC130993019 [Salvia miltiorrhiza]
MAEATRFKDLQEAQKKLDQYVQTESMKRAAAEERIQEHITFIDQKMQGIDTKYDHLTGVLAEIQLQLLNLDKGKSYREDESILGDPPSGFQIGGNHSKNSSYTSKFKIDYPQSGMGNSFHKVDFPRFNGTNPRAWIIKCNSYFKLTAAMTDEHKVQLAIHNFEGKALQWFQNFGYESVLDVSWDQFLQVVAARFEDINESKIIMEFKNLKQSGSYVSYVEKFEELRACLLLSSRIKYSEEYFVANFVSGLSEELQNFMMLFKPGTLQEAIEIGQRQISTLEAIARRVKPTSNRPFSSAGPISKRPGEDAATTKSFTQNNLKPPIKLLTSAERAARREKGLCFNCDEPYVYGHKCKHRVFFMTMTEEQEMEYSQYEGIEGETLIADPITEPMEEIQLSLHSLMGEIGLTTMKVVGEVEEHKLHILVDTGSTLSFLQESTAKKLGCKMEEVKPIMVRVANGQKLISTRQATNFTWGVQGHQFIYSPRVLASEGYDLILGGDWLKYCTPIELDYNKMTFTVNWNGKKVKLQAATNSVDCHLLSEVQLYTLFSKDVTEVEEAYLLIPPVPGSNAPEVLTPLLEEFADVFADPQGLPPARGIEHQIKL